MRLSMALRQIPLQELENYIKTYCKTKYNISKLYKNLLKVKCMKTNCAFKFEEIKDDLDWDSSVYHISLNKKDENGIYYGVDLIPLKKVGNYHIETGLKRKELIKQLVSLLYEIGFYGDSEYKIFKANWRIFGFRDAFHKYFIYKD